MKAQTLVVVIGAYKKRKQLGQKDVLTALTPRHALNPPNARGSNAHTAHCFTSNASKKEKVPSKEFLTR